MMPQFGASLTVEKSSYLIVKATGAFAVNLFMFVDNSVIK
jgi:hypothetical protein